MSEPTCGTCKFWVFWREVEWSVNNEGNCHRFPPALAWSEESGNWGCFPDTKDNDWCGEHKPKEEVK